MELGIENKMYSFNVSNIWPATMGQVLILGTEETILN